MFKGLTQRVLRNLATLAPLGDGNANSHQIASRNAARHEAARLVGVALRRIKADRQQAMVEIELYLDDWVFNNGAIRTREQFQNAVVDCVDRITKRNQAARQSAEDAAESDLVGLKDFPF